jgi:hypothetical protein
MRRALVLALVALAPALALADDPRDEMRQALERHAETELLVQSLPGVPPGRPAQVRRPTPEAPAAARAVAAESAARVLRSETTSAVAAQVRSAAKSTQAAAGQAAAKAALDRAARARVQPPISTPLRQ